MDITYTDCLFTSRSRDICLPAMHPSPGRHLATHTASSFSTFQGSTGHPTAYMQSLWACSIYVPPGLPLLWPPACICGSRDTPILCYLLGQCQRPSVWDYHWILIWGCEHCTSTWDFQTHSRAHCSCINASGPYIFSLTWSLISWPSCMICWDWPSLYTSFLCRKSYGPA